MIRRLRKRGDRLLLTSRRYREVNQLAKIRGIITENYGIHGGNELYGKLDASIKRMDKLARRIHKFSPDVTISFCSPEASRISFGLGIPHIAFCNAPHSEKVMRLSLPLVQKLLIPFHIPKKNFAKYGISTKNIRQYHSMDEYLIVKNPIPTKKTGLPKDFKLYDDTILFRTFESQASYATKKIDTIKMIKTIARELQNCNIVVLGRYVKEIKRLQKMANYDNIVVLDSVVDSGAVLSMCDVFVGSGGTMTSEAALRGIPTISYNAVPNLDEKYLVKKGLVRRAETERDLIAEIGKLLQSNPKPIQTKAKRFLNSMEDPFLLLGKEIKSLVN